MRVAARSVAAVATALTMLVGCGRGSDGAPRTVGGPLVPPVDGEAGVSIYVPASAPSTWAGTFSALPLCARDETGVRVTGVRVGETVGDVLDLQVLMSVHRGSGSVPAITSTPGRAPRFEEAYADVSPRLVEGRRYVAELDEVEIPDCTDARATQPQLTFVLAADAAGAGIVGWAIEYEVGGERFETESISYEMVLCGTGVGPGLCD